MGAEGGIKIFKIEDLKQNWEKLKVDTIGWAKEQLNWCYEWEKERIYNLIEKCKNLPDYISDMDYLDIVKMLQIFKNCETPYLYEDKIIIAYGDNVSKECQIFSDAIEIIETISIETWT